MNKKELRALEGVAVVDFETFGIEPRPDYPPKPVGVSIMIPGGHRPIYLAWGHPTGNNATEAQARETLRAIWERAPRILFHNAKFDLAVAEAHLALPLPRWDRVEDTLFQLFLHDPHARSLSLKPASERVLGMKPEERDTLREWILEHVPEAKRKPSSWGAYIALAPGDLVASYANGDTLRTARLHAKLRPEIARAGMDAAYDRERRLLPYLMANERDGVRVDTPRLRRDIPLLERSLLTADDWVRKKLKSPEMNLDSNDELAEALLRNGYKDFLRTPNGNMSVGKASLQSALESDPRLLSVIGYRNRLTTCLSTFLRPWVNIAQRTGGRIHTSWHQVRQGHGNDAGLSGARTGRIIASEPNLLNLAKSFEDRDDGYAHPAHVKALLPLPLVRVYLLPDKGHVWGHRDYNQQELRMVAHFEDGALQRAYHDNPELDVHNYVRDQIHAIRGILMERRPVKTVNFGMLYGMGLNALSLRLGVDTARAKNIRDAQRSAIPDVRQLEAELKRIGESGEPIRTWGGRLYYAEPPKVIDGKTQRFEYKLLNYLIQGSSSDVTKEAVIRYHEHPQRKEGRFLVTVYDEVNASLPRGTQRQEMQALREAMESVEVDVPMLTDGKVGRSWGELKPYADPKKA